MAHTRMMSRDTIAYLGPRFWHGYHERSFLSELGYLRPIQLETERVSHRYTLNGDVRQGFILSCPFQAISFDEMS